MAGIEYLRATGRRKCATAQVRLRAGNGKVQVNGLDFEKFFTVEAVRGYIMQPMKVTNTLGQYDLVVTLRGGGSIGQAGAMRHGVARALLKDNVARRGVLKQSGMLTRDARVKERKKPGQPGARKRFQFSKR